LRLEDVEDDMLVNLAVNKHATIFPTASAAAGGWLFAACKAHRAPGACTMKQHQRYPHASLLLNPQWRLRTGLSKVQMGPARQQHELLRRLQLGHLRDDDMKTMGAFARSVNNFQLRGTSIIIYLPAKYPISTACRRDCDKYIEIV
jgi:hypothetical protein